MAKNWNVIVCTKYTSVKQYFLCNLKEEGFIQMEHVPVEEINVDLFTTNLPEYRFEKNEQMYCENDDYRKQEKELKLKWSLPNL